jgi:hypothetical protein
MPDRMPGPDRLLRLADEDDPVSREATLGQRR